MLLNSGQATIRRGTNKAPAGGKPAVVYDQQLFTSYYGFKTVGISRFWAAMEHNSRADLLIEVPRCGSITTADLCELQSFEDTAVSGRYKILQVQHLQDEDGLPVTDLTLERIGELDEQT